MKSFVGNVVGTLFLSRRITGPEGAFRKATVTHIGIAVIPWSITDKAGLIAEAVKLWGGRDIRGERGSPGITKLFDLIMTYVLCMRNC